MAYLTEVECEFLDWRGIVASFWYSRNVSCFQAKEVFRFQLISFPSFFFFLFTSLFLSFFYRTSLSG